MDECKKICYKREIKAYDDKSKFTNLVKNS